MVGRFAPSPTGPLHLGSLRTALAAWLFARAAGSSFLMRIEDLDPQRSTRKWEQHQLADLRALGIDWDGEPVRQSERFDRYESALSALTEEGRLYPCFCTRAEIRAAASAPHGDLPEGGAYPGTCRALAPAERRARLAAGERHALRVDAGGAGRAAGAAGAAGAVDEAGAGGIRIGYEDRLLGLQDAVVDDFVVRRADGVPAYQLAVVIDDADRGVEQVVRGADLAGSTPRQILLARWLGLPVPAYAHVGLVLGPDGARLAKRHGAATLADRREPVAATLALLAHSLGLARDREHVETAAELLGEFDPEALPRGPVTLGT
jgi:glutamyl-tRNA synthetase